MEVVNQLVGRLGGHWNPSTLSGAIDVLVVEQPDGSLAGTPFHARFGKRGVIRPQGNAVDIYVNDKLVVGLAARLGPAGEVIFCAESPPLPQPLTAASTNGGAPATELDEWVEISPEAASAMGQIDDTGHFSEPETTEDARDSSGASRFSVWRWGHLPKKSSSIAKVFASAAAASALSLSTRWTSGASSSSLASADKGSTRSDGMINKDVSIRLTSEQLNLMCLKPGVNLLRYEVTTKYQGTASCVCEVHLWRHDDRLVVSDIDGTITRSDLLGQLLPMVGKDWTQPTVARLFSAVHRNGYRFLYLSSRGLGQSAATRRFLDTISQEGDALPEGPVLLSPASLLAALHREVIARRPQEFKIPCLRDIRTLFPSSHSSGGPFWAGFGNRATDADTYAEVGIPPERCFTINSRGELIRGGFGDLADGCGPAASYLALMAIADRVFPSWRMNGGEPRAEPRISNLDNEETDANMHDPDAGANAEGPDSNADADFRSEGAIKRRRCSSSTAQAVCMSEVNFFV